MPIRANIWHLIGRLNQPAADGFLPLRAFKPSSSESADRGRSIIQVMFKPSPKGAVLFKLRWKRKIYGIRLKMSKVCFIFTNKARNHMYISRINIMKFCCIIHFEWYLLWFFKNCDQQNLLPRSREKWLVKLKYFSWTAMRTHSPIHLFESAHRYLWTGPYVAPFFCFFCFLRCCPPFFLTSTLCHINNILQLSMYHCMTYIQ
jgi:hypothetical protein